MLIQIISDIHLETNGLRILDELKPICDCLILAGDVGDPASKEYHIFMKYISQQWKNILYITGNHEYYDTTGLLNKDNIDNIIDEIIQPYPNIHVLRNDSYIINNVEFIGSTLWSSPIVTDKINDFNKHIINDSKPVTMKTFYKWNQESIDYLQTKLEKPSELKRCIITHFMPLQNCDIPDTKYTNDVILDSYFGNKLYDLVPIADVWVSGHTHQRFEFTYKSTPWLCNPYGHEIEKITYKPMIFEL